MNTTLPRTSAAARLQAVFAAAIVTLAMLSGIDSLASNDHNATLASRNVAAQTA